jgi:hypothetical protein
MTSQWYCRIREEEIGPLSFQDMRAMVASGQLAETALVKRQGAETWDKAYTVIGLFAGSTPERQADLPLSDPRGDAIRRRPTEPLAPVEAGTAVLDRERPPGHSWKGFWRTPLDRVELALLGGVVLWLAATLAYMGWSNQPERFPPPRGADRAATNR